MSDTNEDGMTVVKISREPIELCQLLKIANLVQSGGEAKLVIGEGLVRVNDSVENRKRRKIYAGDIVEFSKNRIRVETGP